MKYTANQYAENTIINITLNDQNQKIITFLGYGWRTDADDNDPHPYRFSHYGDFTEDINIVLSDGIRKYEGRESEFVQQYIDEYSAQELVEVYETYDNGNMPKIIKTNQLTENTPCGTYIVDMTNALENKTYKNKTYIITDECMQKHPQLAIKIEVTKQNIDLKQAIKDACREFIVTPEGLKLYSKNHEQFNWQHFAANVPNAICEKYGFKKVQTDNENVLYEKWNESLVDQPKFIVSEIEWDTDEEDVDLPTEREIPVRYLLYPTECLDNCDITYVKNRIVEYLTDAYGFCIKSLVIE